MSADANATTAAAAAPAAPVYRVFFGNLPYSVNEEKIQEFFKDTPDFIKGSIVRRYNKHLGYGFAEFKTEAAANAAVPKYNQLEVDGRKINVELATGEKKEKTPRAPRAPRRSNNAGSEGENNGDGSAPAQSQRARNPRTRRPRNRAPGARTSDEGTANNNGDAAAASGSGEGAPRARRPRRNNRRRGNANGDAPKTEGGAAAEGQSERQPRVRQPRRPRENESTEPKVESKTLLFVANLPFTATGDSLKSSIFTGYNIVDSSVVTTKSGRSKGYGFVNFANEAERDKALNAVQGKEVEGRPLNLKKAFESQAKPNTEGTAAAPAQN